MRPATLLYAALMMVFPLAAIGEDLPPVIRDAPPMRSPEESLKSLVPRPGFRVELMAAEPLVMDPVDIAWGPDGRTWVAEMAAWCREHPEAEDGIYDDPDLERDLNTQLGQQDQASGQGADDRSRGIDRGGKEGR